MHALKLAKIPDRTPVRLTVALPPELHRSLTDYAAIYRETYGQEESVADLIPFILQAFIDGDRSFARACRLRDRGANTSRSLQSPRAAP